MMSCIWFACNNCMITAVTGVGAQALREENAQTRFFFFLFSFVRLMPFITIIFYLSFLRVACSSLDRGRSLNREINPICARARFISYAVVLVHAVKIHSFIILNSFCRWKFISVDMRFFPRFICVVFACLSHVQLCRFFFLFFFAPSDRHNFHTTEIDFESICLYHSLAIVIHFMVANAWNRNSIKSHLINLLLFDRPKSVWFRQMNAKKVIWQVEIDCVICRIRVQTRNKRDIRYVSHDIFKMTAKEETTTTFGSLKLMAFFKVVILVFV